MKKYFLNILSLFSLALLINCQDNSIDQSKHKTLIEKIEENLGNSKKPILENESLPNKDLVLIDENNIQFYVHSRKKSIASYECSECHSKPIAELKSKAGKSAHWEISMNHAAKETMDCFTCHSKSNMDVLTSLTKSEIDYDKSNKLCSQCHSKEHTDWVGGAHGKKVSGWAFKRVSKSCVECHNPHNPEYESKWPSRYNTLNSQGQVK